MSSSALQRQQEVREPPRRIIDVDVVCQVHEVELEVFRRISIRCLAARSATL